jgi:hypothetical protein
MGVRGIFVVGSPRSGTTMLGNYLGSARSVLNTGEYRALYLTLGALPIQLYGVLPGLVPPDWEPRRLQYMHEAQEHAIRFVRDAAAASSCTWFCDSTPGNIFIASQLAELFPDALFVLSLRHYTGVIQSLQRLGMMSLLQGSERSMDFVEPTAIAAAVYWTQHYQLAPTLPADRTVVFGYDAFCNDPASVLTQFKNALVGTAFPAHELDDRVFSTSHAIPGDQPRTTAGLEGRLRPIASYDATSWSDELDREVRPYVRDVDGVLQVLFPDQYEHPAGYEGIDDHPPDVKPDDSPTGQSA